jgi:hypothetical protein
MHGLLEMAFVSEIVLQAKIATRANERLQVANDNLDNIEVGEQFNLFSSLLEIFPRFFGHQLNWTNLVEKC